MNRSEKKDFVEKLKEELNSSSSVIVAHYSGITVDEAEQLRKDMRDNGCLLYTSPSPRDAHESRMPSSA